MGFSLFGGSGDKKTSTVTTTTVTDASATAAEGGTSLSGGSQLIVNTVAPEIFEIAAGTVENVAGRALDTGLGALAISANLVPDLLASQGQQSSDMLRAAQENVSLARQFASAGLGAAQGVNPDTLETVKSVAGFALAAAVAIGLALWLRK